MAKKLVAKVGEYTNREGETKGRYVNVGVILEKDGNEFLLLDPTLNLAGILIQQRLFNPQKAGEKVLVSIFTDEPRQQTAPPPPKDKFSDEIPF